MNSSGIRGYGATSRFFVFGLAVLALALLGASRGARAEDEGPSTRETIPPELAQTAAEEKIRSRFKSEYRGKRPRNPKTLGREYLRIGQTERDPALRFVLLREARDLAISVGDTETCDAAIAAIAKTFVVDRTRLRVDAYSVLARSLEPVELTGKLVEIVDGVADESAFDRLEAEEGFEILKDLESLLKKGARATRSEWPRSIVTSRLERVKRWRRQKSVVTRATKELLADASHPGANEELGRFLAVELGSWRSGLERLRRCGNRELADVAKKDLSSPTELGRCERLGELWMAIAAKEKRSERHGIGARAGLWFGKALKQSSGLARSRIEEKLFSAAPEMFLSDLEPVDSEVGYGELGFGKLGFSVPGISDTRIRVEGVPSPRGIAMHAKTQGDARVSFRIRGQFQHFSAFVGLNDTARPTRQRASVRFLVVGDDKVLWESKPMRGSGKHVKCDVAIARVEELALVATCKGRRDWLHCVWLDPVVRK